MSQPPYSGQKPSSLRYRLLERISYLMDEQFRLPGTKFRFGLDPIINLVPFIGDISGLIVSGGLLFAVARKGATNKLVVLMCINILIDTVVGAIPLVGQIFDFFFKSNTRNLKLVKEHYLEGKHQGSGKQTLVIAITIILAIAILIIIAVWKIVEWLF